MGDFAFNLFSFCRSLVCLRQSAKKVIIELNQTHHHPSSPKKEMPVTRRSHGAKSARVANPRRVTSAIPGLSIADVRRVLDTIRRGWTARTEARFELSAHAINDMTVQDFALAFVMGHQRRRARASDGTS